VCEVSLEGRGHHLRCKAAAADGFAAVDLAVEKLEQQLHKAKSKLLPRKARRGEAVVEVDAEAS
jgi:ribosomal subunit interface protein